MTLSFSDDTIQIKRRQQRDGFFSVKTMYFGSVRFFKHLIITMIALMIIIPWILAITFGVQNSQLKREVTRLSSSIDISNTSTPGVQGDQPGDDRNQDSSDADTSKPDDQASSNSEAEETPVHTPPDPDGPAYQSLYPDLYVKKEKQVANPEGNKIVYLTFDDGPSKNTEKILDILDEYKIKATFFVKRHDEPEIQALYKEIVERGHTIALHSSSHDYKKIYASVEAFLDDFNEIYEYVYSLTGVHCNLFRFPGGSNATEASEVNPEIAYEMRRRGFIYHDWNNDSGDADKSTPSAQYIINKTLNTISSSQDKYVVLMHDAAAKTTTPEALPTIIEELLNQGFKFDKLDGTVKNFDWQRLPEEE